MGKVAAAAAVIALVVFLYFALLAGILGLDSDQTSEVSLWLRNIETWAGVFEAGITGSAIIIGGIFAYYRFFKEEPYSDQLQDVSPLKQTLHPVRPSGSL